MLEEFKINKHKGEDDMKILSLQELELKYPEIPDHMLMALMQYRDVGRPGRGFLKALLCNDLMGTLERADNVNVKLLRDYGILLFNNMPRQCFGSPERYRNWVQHRGLENESD